ncbi:MAG: hypothetical protein HQK96_01495 [Nitrospirae bacterium]|nr:hypothetical protein [Nitrospirota bacterium]
MIYTCNESWFIVFNKAIERVAMIWDVRHNKIDMGTKTGYLREIDEFFGLGEFNGLINRVIFLFRNKQVGEEEVFAVIEHWEELWYKVLGYKKP